MGEFTISSRDVMRANAGNAADPGTGRGQLREQVIGAVKAVQQQNNAAPAADAAKEDQASLQSTASSAQLAEQIDQLNKADYPELFDFVTEVGCNHKCKTIAE